MDSRHLSYGRQFVEGSIKRAVSSHCIVVSNIYARYLLKANYNSRVKSFIINKRIQDNAYNVKTLVRHKNEIQKRHQKIPKTCVYNTKNISTKSH